MFNIFSGSYSEAYEIDALPFSERKKAMRLWLKARKERLVCSECGAKMQEFHHNQGRKTMKINAMVRKACTMKQLISELNLTVPLCHDCHVKATQEMKK